MRISDLSTENERDRTRISAEITWEDTDRDPQQVYFETESEFSQSIRPNPHAFVIASILPALYFGERRLHLDEEICPKLKDGLVTAQHLLLHWWYPRHRKPVVIEAKTHKTVAADGMHKNAAFCFSGGIDSLATLYKNREEYPAGHPGYLKDGLVVFGLEVRDPEKFENVLNAITSLAEEANLTFIPVYTNIIQLGPQNSREFWEKFWLNEYMSASFSSIAHAFHRRWNSFAINSSHDVPNLIPHGSNPLLTSCYSSWEMPIKEEGISYSRFRKTKLISNWDAALKNLRVCNVTDAYQDGSLNCGKCEKCIRTMLALHACGALEKTECFQERKLSRQVIDEAVALAPNTVPLYRELVEPLRSSGNSDLAEGVVAKINDYYTEQKRKRIRQMIKNPVLKFDQKYLNDSLRKINAAMRGIRNLAPAARR